VLAYTSEPPPTSAPAIVIRTSRHTRYPPIRITRHSSMVRVCLPCRQGQRSPRAPDLVDSGRSPAAGKFIKGPQRVLTPAARPAARLGWLATLDLTCWGDLDIEGPSPLTLSLIRSRVDLPSASDSVLTPVPDPRSTS
jgi:hypothetical protein